VQVVNKGKSVRFDVQGVRLPSLVVVKLRSIPEKTGNPAKDVVKVDQSLVPRGSEFVAYIDDDVSLDIAAPAAAPAPVVRPATTTPAVPPAEPAKPVITPAPAPAPAAPPVTTPAPAPPAEVKPAEPAPPPVPAPETPPPVPAPTVAVPAAPAQAVPPVAPAETPKPASTPVVVAPAAPVRPAPAVPTPAPAVPAPAPGLTGMEGVTEWVTVECFSVPSGADILIDGDFYGNTPSILRLPVGKHRLRFILTDYAASSQELELTAGAALRTVRAELEKKEQ
jgi:hypothetical protein